jgi:hypothetical protein
VEELLVAFTGIPRHPLPPKGPFVGSPFAHAATAASAKSLLATTVLQSVRRGPDLRLGGADLDGVHYGNSVLHRCSVFCNDPNSAIEYNLSRGYRAFEAVVGVLDDAEDPNQIGYFQVFLDNVAQPQEKAVLGAAVRIRYDVSGVLRMRPVANRPDTVGSPPMAGRSAPWGKSSRLPALAWGNPMLFV